MSDIHHEYALHLLLLILQIKRNLSTSIHNDAMHVFPKNKNMK